MPTSQSIAASITKAASKQTYYTIRFLADRGRVEDAYRAYAYFRWVDDTLDQASAQNGASRPEAEAHERIQFLERQKLLLETCYCGESIRDATREENMLIELTRHDHEQNSGLQAYLRNMMRVMEFDAGRRGRQISYAELSEYTRWLATAVTEAMHYFIGHGSYSPHDESRYLAVSGAHVAHMLRDTFDDVEMGYYNIPREVLEASHIRPQDLDSNAYRDWVKGRIKLARECFQAGRDYLSRVQEPRCRLAGLAYTARFEWLLDTIEREQYRLRPEYSERKGIGVGMRMATSTVWAYMNLHATPRQRVVSQSLRKL